MLLSSRIDIGDTLAPLDLDAHALDTAMHNAFALSKRWLVGDFDSVNLGSNPSPPASYYVLDVA